jgi:hypothetical protein
MCGSRALPPGFLALLFCLSGCGGVQDSDDGGSEADAGDGGDGGDGGDALDAGDEPDAADDGGEADAAPPDAACLPRAIFLGGTDPVEQGWTVNTGGSGTENLSTAGPSITEIATDTTVGPSGGMLLLSLADAVEPGEPFAIELVMRVLRVDPHNSFDGAAVLMGSYQGGFGAGPDRAQMLYIDPDAIGWTDDTQSAAAASIDGEFHTYVLAVDAAGNATVSRDGVSLLSRAGFVADGNIAFGDQTNDGNVDAQLWIRSLSLLCP